MNKKVQIVIWIIICILVLALLGGYVYSTVTNLNTGTVHPIVTFEIQDYGTIEMELYPEYAPNTVTNFIKLVESGYYNNKVIYGKDEICLYVGRDSEGEAINPTVGLISDEIEEGSDEDYEYSISGEFIANGFEQNTLKHEKGIVSLIRNDYTQYVSGLYEESYNSGNAQLGIMMSDDCSNLNGSYAAFARITSGLDILEAIYNNDALTGSTEETTTEATDETTEAETTVEVEETEVTESEEEEEESTGEIEEFTTYPVITSATVETFGVDYGMPEVEEAFDYSSYLYNLMSSYYSY